MDDNPHERAMVVKGLAREVGFDLAGVARVDGERDGSGYGDFFREWIRAGKQGEMDYLARDVEERLNVRRKFPWARSVACVGLGYFQEGTEALGHKGTEGEMGRIARYAWGRDYHRVMRGKLRKLEGRVREVFGGAAGGGETLEMRGYCDTGPLMERELAGKAGLGWVGKNTLLIHPRHGSWFVLGELVTSLELEGDSAVADHCGTCRRCIEACPTGAIEAYTVDARKCISYLTLEHGRGGGTEIEGGLRAGMKEAGYVVGCDICQEVCPFNRRPLEVTEREFLMKGPAPAVRLAEVLAWQEAEWDRLTRGRAFRRAKLEMWKRNARVLGIKE